MNTNLETLLQLKTLLEEDYNDESFALYYIFKINNKLKKYNDINNVLINELSKDVNNNWKLEMVN